jgi:hypothetical protein
MTNLNLIFIIIIALFIILNNRLPSQIHKLLDNPIVKIIMLLTIIIISNNYKTISILLTLVFIISLNYNNVESFSNKKMVQTVC